jgi:G3E family GTPase
MELIVISGFLGSGKTSLLLLLAKAFVAEGRKVAIVENEVGQNGIDGDMLKAEGLNVREIYSGCVCCSLRIDLIHTLLELERAVKPDLVFLEPSGVAGPKQIKHCLCGYGGNIEKQTFLVVADAKRLPAIRDFSMPLIHDGLEIADLVALNKSDLVSAQQLNDLEVRIREINPSVDLLCVSATTGFQVNGLIEKIKLRTSGKPETSPVEHAKGNLPEAAIFAASAAIDAPVAQAGQQVKEMLQSLCAQLKAEKGVLIGHIKAILKTEPTGYLVYSVTAENEPATEKGRLPQERITHLDLTVNAIVYGADETAFAALCDERFQALTQSLQGGL